MFSTLRISEVGCPSSQKFLARPASGVRKQLVIINDKPSLAFVNYGKKFTACSAASDITSKVWPITTGD